MLGASDATGAMTKPGSLLEVLVVVFVALPFISITGYFILLKVGRRGQQKLPTARLVIIN